MSDDRYQEIEVDNVVRTTPKACLMEIAGEEHWVPFSCIEDNGEEFVEGFKGNAYIETWFCDKEGIEY